MGGISVLPTIRKAPSVAVVNQALADRYFPHAAAIGKKLWLGGPKAALHGNRRRGGQRPHRRPDARGDPEIYLSLWQASAFSKHLVVRTAADPRSLMAAVQRELRSVDPTVAVENVKTLEQIRGDSLASRTFAMQLLAGFAMVGSVLTLVGIYGVLSLSVASRRRELAIRSAVGAQQRDIRNLIFARGISTDRRRRRCRPGRRAGPIARPAIFPLSKWSLPILSR